MVFRDRGKNEKSNEVSPKHKFLKKTVKKGSESFFILVDKCCIPRFIGMCPY